MQCPRHVYKCRESHAWGSCIFDSLWGLLKDCPLGLRPPAVTSLWAGTHGPLSPLGFKACSFLAIHCGFPTRSDQSPASVLCFPSQGYEECVPAVTSNQTGFPKQGTFMDKSPREKSYHKPIKHLTLVAKHSHLAHGDRLSVKPFSKGFSQFVAQDPRLLVSLNQLFILKIFILFGFWNLL